MPNGLELSLSQEDARQTAHAFLTSLRPIGCSSGARADGIQAPGTGKRRRIWRGERGRRDGVGVCVSPLPIRAFNMPSRDPLLRTAHTSLGCQDNGQQASAVTPHFLCTELSNHDRCRQCRCRHYFLPAWPSRCPTAREEGATGAVIYTEKGSGANLRHLWRQRYCLVLFWFSFHSDFRS